MPHGGLTHVHMHVAKVEYGEAIKQPRQLLEPDVVVPNENAFCVPSSEPIETGQLKCVSNDRMDRIRILDVKEDEAVTEDLRLMVRLDIQSLSRVEWSETLLQFSEISSSMEYLLLRDRLDPSTGNEALTDATEYPSDKKLAYRMTWLICTRPAILRRAK